LSARDIAAMKAMDSRIKELIEKNQGARTCTEKTKSKSLRSSSCFYLFRNWTYNFDLFIDLIIFLSLI
jgi:hypothetical protein